MWSVSGVLQALNTRQQIVVDGDRFWAHTLIAMFEKEFKQAIKRAETKKQIKSALDLFPHQTQREILSELLTDLVDGAHASSPADAPREEEEQEETEPGPVLVLRPTRASQVVSYLRAHPKSPIRKIASEVYGEDDKHAQGQVRSVLTSLKKQGVIRNVGFGEWEVIGR